MTVKMTGAEFKRYYNDDDAWQEGWWHEDAQIEIDGETHDDVPGDIDDSAKVRIIGGAIVRGHEDLEAISMEGHARKWLKTQSTVSLAFDVPKDKVEAVKAAVKAALEGKP